MKLSNYLKFPLSAVRHWFEANETPYTFSEKLHIFKVLLALRFKEIGGTKNKIITQNIFGFKVHAYDYTTLLFLFREIFLTKDYLFSSNNAEPKIIDCGANIGMSVFFLKYISPKAFITAFEPNPSAFELLKLNVESNQLQNVTLINKAVSDKKESIDFYVNEDKGTLLASVRSDRGGNKKISIETELLSDLLTQATNLIKIDVEGAEWSILEDFKNHASLIKNVNQIIMEYHHKINNEASRLTKFLSFFEEQGFEYNIRTTYRNQGDFQDLIINFYRA